MENTITIDEVVAGIAKINDEHAMSFEPPIKSEPVVSENGQFTATFKVLEPGNYCAPVYNRHNDFLTINKVPFLKIEGAM